MDIWDELIKKGYIYIHVSMFTLPTSLAHLFTYIPTYYLPT
jgi:hypothetical protein